MDTTDGYDLEGDWRSGYRLRTDQSFEVRRVLRVAIDAQRSLELRTIIGVSQECAQRFSAFLPQALKNKNISLANAAG